ncbi:hypothetical protein [Nocardioides sp.]|uniref:hypothetical protein n=1 Tax=Nocardioides sp. TaxID=35761 RepID=UPI003511622A
MSTPNIRVAGRWLSREARFGDLEVTWGIHGAEQATWEMPLKATERPAWLGRGALVQVYDASLCVWQGTLAQPDFDSGQFAAIGIARQGESAACLTSAGAVTSAPNTAINAAIARGVVSWVRAADFGSTPIAGADATGTTSDPDPGSLTNLLDLWANEQDKQWRVTDDGRLIQATDSEAAPTWLVLPGAAELGVADDNALDRLFLRYVDTSGYYRTASYPASTPAGGIERRASIISRGPMDSARASAIAAGIYNAAQAGRTGWTNSLDLVAEQIITPGGKRPRPSAIRPGDTTKILGQRDPRSGSPSTSVVIGEVTWRPSEARVQIKPVGKVARTYDEILVDFKAVAA